MRTRFFIGASRYHGADTGKAGSFPPGDLVDVIVEGEGHADSVMNSRGIS